MAIASNVIIIFSIIGIGFGAGLHLGLIDDNASLYRIQNFIPKDLSYSDGLPFFNLAFMSGESNGLISHATVAFGLGSVVIDPNEEIVGDEYFDNRITQCEFHSEEDIDEPICVVCRIKDTHDEPCVDKWMGLDEFEHGLLLNTQIPGVTVSAVANGNFPDEVMIFVSDNNIGNDDDPDLETIGVGGICTDCLKPNGEGMHIAVIPEYIDGSAGDGIVDIPDDSAWGGTQTWVFDQPWFLKSFDFVDYDRDYNGEARAYDNPQCSGTPVATSVISKNPNGGDGSVQTITMNANNVRCLEVEYEDSGGITNVHLECPKPFDKEKVEFFFDSFEDESTIWDVWYKDDDRTTTPHPNRIWFGQGSSGEIGAHTGQYYLAGSGNIDDLDDTDYDGITNPAWAAKNRYIDISQHTDIWLSFWYSYDNTESNDEFAMYYRVDGGAWQEIFLIDPITQSNQQAPWQFVEIGIPDGSGVEIQFRWETSAGSSDDRVMIDDLKLSGILK